MPHPTTPHDLRKLIGHTAWDARGRKVGTVADLFVGTSSLEGAWAGVLGGFLGLRHRTVPLDGAELREDGEVWLAWTLEQIDEGVQPGPGIGEAPLPDVLVGDSVE